MKTYVECLPCLLRQAQEAARMAKLNAEDTEWYLRQVLRSLVRMDWRQSPPVLGQRIHQLIRCSLVETIDNGSDAPGTVLEDCLTDFRQRLDAADLIIAKGQGNYESLNDVDRPVCFLLRVKCDVVASDLSWPVGSSVVWRQRLNSTRNSTSEPRTRFRFEVPADHPPPPHLPLQ